MRAAPTIAFAGTVYAYDGSANRAIAAITTQYTGDEHGGYIYFQTASGLNAGNSIYIYVDNDLEDEVTASAEL